MENNATYNSLDSRFIDQKRSNVKSDLIEITHDKLENILLKHLKNVTILNSWITPLSLFLTLLVARLTATFNEFMGIKAEVWDAIFLLGLITSVIWFIISIIKIIKLYKKASIEHLLSLIKDATDK